MFVGRAHELNRLEQGLNQALAGRGCGALVTGEAGIGKTRLVEALCAIAETRGVRVAWARAWEAGGAPAFWPWVQLLRKVLLGAGHDVLERLPPQTRAHLAELLPELRSIPVPIPLLTQSADPAQARFERFDAVMAALSAAAATAATGLVVVFDDLQWADRSSVQLVELLLAQVPAEPIFVATTIRVPAWGDEGLDAASFARLHRLATGIELRGLAPDALRALCDADGNPVSDDAWLEALHRATGGNPFFATEVLRLRESTATTGHAIPLPASVRATVTERLSLLPEAVRDVLAAAAVLGPELDPEQLVEICRQRREDVIAALGHAIDAGFLRRSGESAAMFVHGLVRETIREQLSATERADLHWRAAQVLEQQGRTTLVEDVATLAHHFDRGIAAGCDPAKSIQYALQAGARARALLLHDEAVPHLARASQRLRQFAPHDLTARCSCLVELVDAMWLGSRGSQERVGESREGLCLQAIELARQLDDPEFHARAVIALNSPFPQITPPGSANEPLTREIEAALGRLPAADNRWRSRLLARLAVCRRYAGETGDGPAQLAFEAVAMARRCDDDAGLVDTLLRACFAIWGPDDADERQARVAEIRERAERGALTRFSEQVAILDMILALEHGEIREAKAALKRCEAYARRIHDPVIQALLPIFVGTIDLLEGRFASAEPPQLQLSGGNHLVNNWLRIRALMIAWETGSLPAQIPALQDAAGSEPGNAMWQALLALAEVEGGDHAAGMVRLQALRREGFSFIIRDWRWYLTLWSLGETVIRLEDSGCAAELYALLEPYADRCAHHSMIWSGGALARSVGHLALVMGEPGSAGRYLAQSLERNASMGARPALGWTCWALAEAAARTGDGEALGEHMETGRNIARELGMNGLDARLQALAARYAVADDEQMVFRRSGEGWLIGSGDREAVLPDAKGLSYLAMLLPVPGREIPAARLAARLEGIAGEDEIAALGDAGEQLDRRAIADYRERLRDIELELESATEDADLGRCEQLSREQEMLRQQLSSAVGLGGKIRRDADVGERVRKAVGNRIRAAIRKIEAHDARLASHLRASIHTGNDCVYRPADPVRWIL